MKHLGDITKINGHTAPIVDCIIGGSPCQDLSVAGKRAGLNGERSGLYMEQIRIVREMRNQDERNGRTGVDVRPRYMVWENVPGAFSSNKGEDFRIVLEELAKVKDKDAIIPKPADGKWRTSGCVVGDGWSVAWRVLDAQFWGVPQRRRRIALVADFGGKSAPEILFKRQGVPGYITTCGKEGQGAPGNIETSTNTASIQGAYCIRGNCIGRADTAGCNGKGWSEGVSYTINTIDRHAVLPFCASPSSNGGITLKVHPFDPAQITAPLHRNPMTNTEKCHTLHRMDAPAIVSYLNAFVLETDKASCLSAGSLTGEAALGVATEYIVRRLTPLECERLQGFPDGWTDIGEYTDSKGKVHKECADSARYKALGNSVALPPWKWVLKRLCACYERDATMASLFDGIGGFPYLWEQLNGKGTCLWASEIEEFPMSVTKVRIGE